MIVLYHGLLPAPPSAFAAHARTRVSVARFEAHLAAFRRAFRVLPLAEYAASVRAEGRAPPGCVCITFDDGYASVLRLAVPVMRRMGVPATVFCTVQGGDGGLLWHDVVPLWFRSAPRAEVQERCASVGVATGGDGIATLRSLKRTLKSLPAGERDAFVGALRHPPVDDALEETFGARLLDWDGMRALRAQGFQVGNHTWSHAMLRRCDGPRTEHEVAAAAARLCAELGVDAHDMPFAYPNGGARDAPAGADAMVRSLHGCAVLADGPGPADDVHRLPRVNAGDEGVDVDGLVAALRA